MEGKTIKVAWIREPGYPAGVPAPGYFDCLCGIRITGVEFGQPGLVGCVGCGRQYNGRGWLKKGPDKVYTLQEQGKTTPTSGYGPNGVGR